MFLIVSDFFWLFDSKRIRSIFDVGKSFIVFCCSLSEDVRDVSISIYCDIFYLSYVDSLFWL